MSDELARLRADLQAMERIAGLWVFSDEFCNEYHEQKKKIRDKIARLEAEADPWREAKDAIRYWGDNAGYSALWAREAKVIAYVDHLTAENADLKQKYDMANDTIKTATDRLNEAKAEVARLTATVAELEAFQAKWCDSFDLTDSDRKRMAALIQAESQPGPDDPILDPARVMATAKRWLTDSEVQNHGHIGFLIDTHCRHTIGDAKPYRLKGAENGS